MFKKLVNKSAKTVGETAGNIISGTAKGLVNGLIGEETEEAKKERLYRRELRDMKEQIVNWAWRLFMCVQSLILLQYILFTGFSNIGFEKMISERGIILAIPVLLLIIFINLADNIAQKRVSRD